METQKSNHWKTEKANDNHDADTGHKIDDVRIFRTHPTVLSVKIKCQNCITRILQSRFYVIGKMFHEVPELDVQYLVLTYQHDIFRGCMRINSCPMITKEKQKET